MLSFTVKSVTNTFAFLIRSKNLGVRGTRDAAEGDDGRNRRGVADRRFDDHRRVPAAAGAR